MSDMRELYQEIILDHNKKPVTSWTARPAAPMATILCAATS